MMPSTVDVIRRRKKLNQAAAESIVDPQVFEDALKAEQEMRAKEREAALKRKRKEKAPSLLDRLKETKKALQSFKLYN